MKITREILSSAKYIGNNIIRYETDLNNSLIKTHLTKIYDSVRENGDAISVIEVFAKR